MGTGAECVLMPVSRVPMGVSRRQALPPAPHTDSIIPCSKPQHSWPPHRNLTLLIPNGKAHLEYASYESFSILHLSKMQVCLFLRDALSGLTDDNTKEGQQEPLPRCASSQRCEDSHLREEALETQRPACRDSALNRGAGARPSSALKTKRGLSPKPAS